MSTRVVVALHVAWMAVFVGLALWAGWLFRFEGDRGFYYLDRWTGELVEGDGDAHYRYSLRRAVQKEFLVDRITADPEGVAARQDAAPTGPGTGFHPLIPKRGGSASQPPATGAFDDLTPKRGDSE